MSGGRNSFTLRADLTALDSLVDQLEDDFEAAARPSAQAAAQILYDDILRNVAGIRRVTGNLSKSIYQAYSASSSRPGYAVYHVSWNAKKAPHGGLVEYGHLQRYRYYRGADGQIRPMVRPGMDGRKRPSRHAPQSVKDAYYVTLPTPLQIPAKAFVRRAVDKFPQAYAAAEAELLRRVNGGGR